LSEQIVKALVNHYRTNPDVHDVGRAWYPDARAFCESIANEAVPVETVARVMAILSPRCFWRTCREWTQRMVAAFTNGEPMPAVSTMRSRTRAWSELHGQPALSGPKVEAFARAILGDHSAVTIDSWVLRTVGLQPEAKVTPHRLRWITAAYAKAAEEVCETPRDMQAIVWCAVRGRSE
jgi:hypothetical protein